MACLKADMKLAAVILKKMESIQAARAYNTAKTLSFVANKMLLWNIQVF
jgi:hypothetical protein